MKLRITILKYHSWYLCQISLQIMLLPIPIFCSDTTRFWLDKYPLRHTSTKVLPPHQTSSFFYALIVHAASKSMQLCIESFCFCSLHLSPFFTNNVKLSSKRPDKMSSHPWIWLDKSRFWPNILWILESICRILHILLSLIQQSLIIFLELYIRDELYFIYLLIRHVYAFFNIFIFFIFLYFILSLICFL